MDHKTFNILVPIGMVEETHSALEQAYFLAKLIGSAEITILAVIEESSYITKMFKTKSEELGLKENLQKELDVIVENAKLKHNLKINSLTAKGKIYTKIIEVSEMIDAKLIVMGKNSYQEGFVGTFIGSNTLNVVRTSKCPVITIRGANYQKESKTIILPIDLTKNTAQKVENALNYAKMFDSTINVISVLLTKDEKIKSRLTEQIDEVKKTIEENGVKCVTNLLTAKKSERASSVIVNYTKEVHGDMVIIMTQQESNITKYFIGSSAQEIINKSEIPVMCIVPKAK